MDGQQTLIPPVNPVLANPADLPVKLPSVQPPVQLSHQKHFISLKFKD